MKSSVGALELKALYEISRIIGQALNLERTLEKVLRILSESMSMKRAAVTLLDDNDQLSIRASYGLTSEEAERGVYRMDEGVTGLIFRSAAPFVVPDVSREPLFLDKTGSRQMEKETLSFIGVPVMLHGRPVGVLTVDHLFDADVSFEEDIRFLTVVATLIAQFKMLADQAREREESLRRENTDLRSRLSEDYARFTLVGKSRSMAGVRQMIEKVAGAETIVLLQGESGTGKTLAARLIHELSHRRSQPFVAVNCSAHDPTHLESEIFGHATGAFPGAADPWSGRLAQADNGTLLLEDISRMPYHVQSKLLRFLQTREFEPVGSSERKTADVRIIAASASKLAAGVEEGAFRDDLYYRLSGFPIAMPALREREGDIPALINHFLERIHKNFGRQLSLTNRALNALIAYQWPGNVREMENLMERLAIITEKNLVDIEDIPDNCFMETGVAIPGPEKMVSLKDMEKREVLSALERHRWVQSRAARELGITLRQMGYRIKKYGLESLVRQRRNSFRNLSGD
jgi:Nif-specific regulatory protein